LSWKQSSGFIPFQLLQGSDAPYITNASIHRRAIDGYVPGARSRVGYVEELEETVYDRRAGGRQGVTAQHLVSSDNGASYRSGQDGCGEDESADNYQGESHGDLGGGLSGASRITATEPAESAKAPVLINTGAYGGKKVL
jgi:hypothetical protein